MGSAIRPFLIAISLSFALATLSCKWSVMIPPICNIREEHEPVHSAHCNCSKSKHLQPAPQTLLRHSSPVSSLSQAVEDLYLNRQQSQIHQNSAPQTAHYLRQHHSKKSKKTATFAAPSAHQKTRAQEQGKAKAKESIYSVSTEQTATRVYATKTRY